MFDELRKRIRDEVLPFEPKVYLEDVLKVVNQLEAEYKTRTITLNVSELLKPNLRRDKFIEECNTRLTVAEAEIRNKALDEFAERIELELSESIIWGMLADCYRDKTLDYTSEKIVDYVIDTAKRVAQQLKERESNE